MNKLNSQVLVAAAAVVLLAGCSHKETRAQAAPAPTAQEKAVTQLDAERTSYVQRIQARIDEMTKFANDLRTQSAAAQKPRSKKLENAADDIDSTLKDANKELADVKTAAPENWLDEKRDVEKSMMRAETQYTESVRLIK